MTRYIKIQLQSSLIFFLHEAWLRMGMILKINQPLSRSSTTCGICLTVIPYFYLDAVVNIASGISPFSTDMFNSNITDSH